MRYCQDLSLKKAQNTAVNTSELADLEHRINNLYTPPLIMGILNVTPDSFYDGGRYNSIDTAMYRVEKMLEEGADIIDVGGESTRPGSSRVSEDEELKRVIPVIKEIKRHFPEAVISIDTYKSKVANEAINEGAIIVNDISALRFDKKMIDVVKTNSVFTVIMHMKGTPETMQENPHYEDPVKEIYNFLLERKRFLEQHGIPSSRIIVDPGIGFGKRVEDNLKILKDLYIFSSLGSVLIGTSRKSFIGAVLNLDVDQRLEGTLASVAISVLNGARIIRVHDVKEAKRAATLAWHIKTI